MITALVLHNLTYWHKPFKASDHMLSDEMCSYWVNFAQTGDPNGPGLPHWPQFAEHLPQLMCFIDSAKAATWSTSAVFNYFDKAANPGN